MTKKLILTIWMILAMWHTGLACPVCEKQQPAITRGITHGAGPQSNWDWLIIALVALITLLTLIYTIRYLVKPGEKHRTHIKHTILNEH